MAYYQAKPTVLDAAFTKTLEICALPFVVFIYRGAGSTCIVPLAAITRQRWWKVHSVARLAGRRVNVKLICIYYFRLVLRSSVTIRVKPEPGGGWSVPYDIQRVTCKGIQEHHVLNCILIQVYTVWLNCILYTGIQARLEESS